MSSYSGPNTVTDKLVIALDAADATSYPGGEEVWYDLSGNGNDCVFGVTPSYTGKHFTFNGSSHYGVITNNATLNFSMEKSLIMILKHTYVSGRLNPWDQAYGGYGTWTHEDGNAINEFFGTAGINNEPYTWSLSPATPRGVWNILCATRNTTHHKWYLNGVLLTTTPHSYGPLPATAANITIGNGYAGYWQGDMAGIFAYTKCLTHGEVLQNYNSLKTRFGL